MTNRKLNAILLASLAYVAAYVAVAMAGGGFSPPQGTGSGASVASVWSRNGTTLSSTTSGDAVKIDSLLFLGGTTSAYPALKRSSTTVQVRLADDSADGGLSCGSATISGVTSASTLSSTGQYWSAQYTCTTTLDWNNGNCQSIQLANNSNTFTFANPRSGARYLLKLKQPSSGAAGTVTWPATVSWPAATAPTLTTTNSKTDIITFYCEVVSGTPTYYGLSSLNY